MTESFVKKSNSPNVGILNIKEPIKVFPGNCKKFLDIFCIEHFGTFISYYIVQISLLTG